MGIYRDITSKLITVDQARRMLGEEFRSHRRIVFTNGCFDILHRGHVYYLSKARELGDLLIVGLNSDDSVRRLKGRGRPVNDQNARAEVLGALSMVDRIILFGEDTPLELILKIRPDVLVKGGDYNQEDIVGSGEVNSWGGEVHTIPFLKGYSTTRIIGKQR